MVSATVLDTLQPQKCQKTATHSTKIRLIEAVLSLWCESPGAELAVRTIAARADASASAIDYHFGNIEQLYEAARKAALDEADQWFAARLAQISGPVSGRVSGLVSGPNGRPANSRVLAMLAATVIDDWCEMQRHLAMARLEACTTRRRSPASASHTQWTRLWHSFWSRWAALLGAGDLGPVIAAFADGKAVQHLMRWNRALDRALLDETVHAFFSHICGNAQQASLIRPVYQQLAEAAFAGEGAGEGAGNGTGSQPADHPLDQAAADILGTSGIAGLTFRGVASHAGSTLGVAAYHFGTKAHMLRAAFAQLYRQAGGDEQALASLPTADVLLREVTDGITKGDQPVLRAFDEVISYISRDRQYFDLRGLIRAFRDPVASRILQILLDRQDGEVPESLGAAFSSLCRGVDHMTLDGCTDADREAGGDILRQFLKASR